MTEDQEVTLAELRRAVEYAPLTAAYAENLHGWRTPDGLYICASHVARIFARGCTIPRGSSPVWTDEATTRGGVCCLCEHFEDLR